MQQQPACISISCFMQTFNDITTTQQLNSKCIGQQMSSSSPKLVIESNVVLFVSGEIISKRCWRSVKNGCDHLPAAWAVYKRGLAMKPASQQAYNLIADSKVKSVTRAVIMFQLLTILLAVTAVVTKAAPLTSHYEQPSSFQQFNVQTGKKNRGLGEYLNTCLHCGSVHEHQQQATRTEPSALQ